MSGRTYYVTTPIYYVNDVPHIGHAYTTLACDVLARFMRLDGRRRPFPDRHRRARAEGRKGGTKQPACRRRLSPTRSSQSFRDLVVKMDYSPDNFIRTTEKRHYAASQALWQKLVASGDIYLGKYAGWYSVRDETYFLESETEVGPDKKRRATGPVPRSSGSRSRRISSSSRPGVIGCSNSTTRTRASSHRKAGATRSSAS